MGADIVIKPKLSYIGYLITIIILLFIFFGLFSFYETSKASNAISEFFYALQIGDLDKANNLLDKSNETKVNLQFDSPDKERLAKAYYSRIEFEIVSNSMNNLNFNLGQKQIAVELKNPDIVPIMRSSLNEVTRLGLSGGIFYGFQSAIAQSGEIFIRNMKNENNQMDTKVMVITVVKKEGNYLLVPDAMLDEILIAQPEKIFLVLDKLQGKE